MIDSKFVSIIIPTYREWGLLSKCVDALSKQTYPAELFEVIIINNDPSDIPPSELLLPQNYRIIAEHKPGSYAARNAGLKIAKGDIIGFTDADCIPETDWIKKAVDYLSENKSCTRVAGKINIIQKSPNPTIIEVYNKLYSFPQEAVIKNHGGSMTANLFTYRYVFDKVGFFNENLLSFGDLAWGSLANKAGFKIDYVENIEVYHPPRNLKELIKKERRLGGGLATLHQGKRRKGRHILKFLYQLRPRVGAVKHMALMSKKLRLKDKMAIPLIRYYFGVIRSFEILRIQLGKKPNRS